MAPPTEKHKAQIIWTLNSVLRSYFNKYVEALNATFKAMFSDSQIAQGFQLGPVKLSYLTNWGPAPYFKDKLKKYVNVSLFISIGFYESLNQKTQKCQMDVDLWYWNEENKKLVSI